MARVVLVPVCELGLVSDTAAVLDARSGELVVCSSAGLTLVGSRVYVPGTWLGREDGLDRVALMAGPAVWVRNAVEDNRQPIAGAA